MTQYQRSRAAISSGAATISATARSSCQRKPFRKFFKYWRVPTSRAQLVQFLPLPLPFLPLPPLPLCIISAVSAGGEGPRPQSPRVEPMSRDSCGGQSEASHNPYCYQHKTCTLSRVITYAFVMNRICTGGIGMGLFDLLCVCFSLVSRDVDSEEDRGAGA